MLELGAAEAAISEEEAKPEEASAQEGAEGEAAPAEGGGSKKKLFLIIGAAVAVVLVLGGGAALYLGGAFSGGSKEPTAEELARAPQITYYDLEAFLVNLNNPGRQVSFLKTTVTLELPNLAAKNAVEAKLPRIRDNFQVYLRELRNADLQGSAGLHRLREELLTRINKIIEPEKVNDILFKEIIVQ